MEQAIPTSHHGRHEHGQNFLIDPAVIATLIEFVTATRGPIVEIGPGDGALTVPLTRLGRPVTAIEIDARLEQRLCCRLPSHVKVVTGDFLTHRLPSTPHVVVGNLPFHQATAVLRRLLHSFAWSDAVLLTQWEVARCRAGMGGATMMIAQWAPWSTFTLHGRVPAQAFIPRPGVDGGILTIHRHEHPLLPVTEQCRFCALVHHIYTGPGNGLAQIPARATSFPSPQTAWAWLGRHGIDALALPRMMYPKAWVDLSKTTGSSPPAPPTRGNRRRRR